ncbi:MAG: nucleotidyl transferase AbiEii/AbiGii toxin family protein [Candidatus Omnitrophota bacterium]|nr:nucleotidyl transferase AbiEii/AbiGii toxin family protein [Candidatus Omnitrophota bacterium]
MDSKLREAQKLVLKVFSREAAYFALAGGTALELYYLHHRFSSDLDFFSGKYLVSEIDTLAAAFEKHLDRKIHLESEFISDNKARVRFYTMAVKGSARPLKIDFVEDVVCSRPVIRNIDGVRVYSAKDLYLHKIAAISGTQIITDEIGRQVSEGRKEARDVFDVYLLSKKIQPLHIFLRGLSPQFQRGVVHWYRTFSRQELKLALMGLDIYDTEFNARELVIYLENEVKQFAKEVIEE